MAASLAARLKRTLQRVVAPMALLLLLLASLYLAADAEGLGQSYAIYYPYVFVGAALALALLAVAILARLWRLRQQLRHGVPGARLTRRLLLLMVLLTLPPVLLVYSFGVRFVNATVDSWLRANSAQALDDALAIGQLYLDERSTRSQALTQSAADAIRQRPESELDAALEDALDEARAQQLVIFEPDGRVRAVAASDPSLLLPSPPQEEIWLQLGSRGHYAATERDAEGMRIRVLLEVDAGGVRGRVLEAVFALPAGYAQLAQRVEAAVHGQRQAAFLRDALKLVFTLILTFVLLLSVLLALLLAIDLARRLVAPIGRLATATRDVAQGRFGAQLPPEQDDELGFLVQSFNHMTRQLELTTAQAGASAAETERQRAFLETVLARLSSGVLVLDANARLLSANPAAQTLIGVDPAHHLGMSIAELRAALPQAAALLDSLQTRLGEGVREWREEVALQLQGERILLLLRGALLPDAGVVAVFDDTSVIDRARREAAWAEVARRLAHEIKNPLTPIQLAAERLRRRVLPKLASDDAEVLDRATHTIVAQVDALKTLVNSFGDYARPPTLHLASQDLNALVIDVLDLYEGDARVHQVRRLAPSLPHVVADSGRVRQVLHNLIKNALEASAGRDRAELEVETTVRRDGNRQWIELGIADNGSGLPADFSEEWFEPYRTTKLKGTGLGLAIVAKIAQEHGGRLHATNRPGGGARFSLWLPLE